MKYTILINQAGIVDAGLADDTDFSDWAILEYIVAWQAHSSAVRYSDHVWINFANLLAEIPMLSVKSKAGVSRRISHLRDLNLLSTVQADGNRLFVRVTDFYLAVVDFRPSGRVVNSVPERPVNSVVPSVSPCSAGETLVAPAEQGVAPAERSVSPAQHSINNNINNNKQTKHYADDDVEGGEALGDEHVFSEPMQWAQFFIQSCDYPFHIVQTSKTIPLFAKWVSEKTTVGEVRLAMAACHGWNGGRVADSPLLYGKFLVSVRDEQKRLADESVFAGRLGVGRSRSGEEWAKVPRDDEALGAWARKHGYVDARRGETYRQFRARLHAAVDDRLAQSAAG